jgi:hypothetical protein
MAPKSNYLISGLAVVAAMICALPAAKGIGASSQEPALTIHVNRTSKGDRLAAPQSIAVRKKPPVQTTREQAPGVEPKERPRIMNGCEPAFSPVTVPSMAHVAGRCVG